MGEYSMFGGIAGAILALCFAVLAALGAVTVVEWLIAPRVPVRYHGRLFTITALVAAYAVLIAIDLSR